MSSTVEIEPFAETTPRPSVEPFVHESSDTSSIRTRNQRRFRVALTLSLTLLFLLLVGGLVALS